MDKRMKYSVDNSTRHQSGAPESQFELITLSSQFYQGQAVKEDGFVVYASITADPKKLAGKSRFKMLEKT
jgi:hypothetical protein